MAFDFTGADLANIVVPDLGRITLGSGGSGTSLNSYVVSNTPMWKTFFKDVLYYVQSYFPDVYPSNNLSINSNLYVKGSIFGDASHLTGLALPTGLTSGNVNAGFINYGGNSTHVAGQWDGLGTTPTHTTPLTYDGYLYATRFYGDGSQLTGLNSGSMTSLTVTATQGTLAFTSHNGGATYSNDLQIYNSYGGGYSKWLRVNSTGGLEIVNSAYNTVIWTCTDTGTNFAQVYQIISSRTKKKDIAKYEGSGLGLVNATSIVNYKFKNDPEQIPHIGFIAEDTPEEMAGKKHDTMNVADTLGVLLKAVQELSHEIDILKAGLEGKNGVGI